MGELIDSKCGIVMSYSLHDIYNIGKSLQHRGRDAAGIGALGRHGVKTITWEGPIKAITLDTLYRIFSDDEYYFFKLHNRYATKGSKTALPFAAHPHAIGGDKIVYDTHIITKNAEASMIQNGQVDDQKFMHLIDKTKLRTDCDTEAFLHLYKKIGEEEIMRQVPGSYSAIIFDRDKKEAIIMRDRHGIKPLWMAEKDGKHIFASETNALESNGARIIREVSPGEILYVKSNGNVARNKIKETEKQFCFFEYVYVQDPRSQNIRQKRFRLGEELAKEFNPEDIEIVTYVPRCPEFVARGYAEGIGSPEKFEEVFYKFDDERSFMKPTQEKRSASIKDNLYFLDSVNVSGKVVGVLDDSLIRGTVIKHAVKLLKDNGAKKVYYCLSTPPIGVIKNGTAHGCMYGIDMPPRPIPDNEFAVRKYGDGSGSAENIKLMEEATGADKIVYLSEDGLFRALKKERSESCYHCIGGPKPFEQQLVTIQPASARP